MTLVKLNFWDITHILRHKNSHGNPAMDWPPIQGGVEILLVASSATETGISSDLMGHLAPMQTFPFLALIVLPALKMNSD